MLLSQAICSILLALSFLFDKAYGRKIIAYRTVSPMEATKINLEKRPYRDVAVDIENARWNILGHGLYTVNEPAGWGAWVDSWHCAIEADMDKVNEASKIWIPTSYTGITKDGKITGEKKLWGFETANEDKVLEYIKLMGVLNPKKALRFAHIPHLPGKIQMVIPTDTINNNDFDFKAECWETAAELQAAFPETVDWENWGIIGSPDIGEPIPIPEEPVVEDPAQGGTFKEWKKTSWSGRLLHCMRNPCDW
ncbi:uncharacterized protein L3040_007101 [Drepanopeziza brunnea f. sp. 'multigermtubi']|uniref:uncharacterized protein n=1 Tax=Drepanopeziza brunnea f. sp. 'multigermtubi' TaxID=698441 RepID=UPI002394556B|nr:hypothetical protein L3040_007101 [Drepanopeziza brunnea f. sp. 'multigermtubi']